MKTRLTSCRLAIPAAMLLGSFCLALTPVSAARAATATTEAASAAASQQSFDTPQAAVDALVAAVKTSDTKSLLEILGPGGEHLVASGDKVADAAVGEKFIASYTQAHSLAAQPDGSEILSVGANAWPMPIPLVQSNGKWTFDATEGAQEIIDRRIGSNELLTIQTLYSCVEAEQDYFNRMQDSTGTGVYASHVFSTPGEENGLYWDASDGETPSPLAPLIAEAQAEGYLGTQDSMLPDSAAPSPYHGYFFRILKKEGPDSAGGDKDYMVDGKMTGGFAFVAYPAVYGSTGIMTFIINQDGVAFQQDLGENTTKLATEMTAFNPDLSWARIDPTN